MEKKWKRGQEMEKGSEKNKGVRLGFEEIKGLRNLRSMRHFNFILPTR